MKKLTLFIALTFVVSYSYAQLNPTIDTSRLRTVIITESALFTGTLVGLGSMWYDEKDRGSFHYFNDAEEWKQMDKVGHVFAAYNGGLYGMKVLEWAGLGGKRKLVYGGTLGLAFLTTVEVFDGFANKWGFSWSDMAANVVGTGLVMGQELAFSEQVVRIKFSYHDNKIPNYREDVLGENLLQQVFKDYNGQTYWASINLASLSGSEDVPQWLNIALGYGATGMPAARSNRLKEGDKTYIFEQYRQYYFSFDIALDRINTRSKFLNAAFDAFSVLKIPFPAIEYNEKGIKLHPIYF